VHAYVVSLARSLDRRAHITRELQKTGLDWEIVTAVDGRELDLSDATLIDPSFVAQKSFPEGSAGCALSHLSVYRKVIADGLDVALILEDDAVLPADLNSLAEDVARKLTGAEAALLSIACPEPCQLSLNGSVRLPSGQLLALPIDISMPRSGAAYIITRQGCERMVRGLLPLRALADEWWFFYRQGLLDRVRCLAPMPVHRSASIASTIGHYSVGTGFRNHLVGLLAQRKIPVLHQLLSYRRWRIHRRWARLEVVDAPFIEMPSRLEEPWRSRRVEEVTD